MKKPIFLSMLLLLLAISAYSQDGRVHMYNGQPVQETPLPRSRPVPRAVPINPEQRMQNGQHINPQNSVPLLERLLQSCDECQTTDIKYVYDFLCGQWYLYDRQSTPQLTQVATLETQRVKYRIPFRIIVANVNRYVYDVSIEADNIDYTSEAPAAFTSLLIGGGVNINNLLAGLGVSESALKSDVASKSESSLKMEKISSNITITTDPFETYDSLRDNFTTRLTTYENSWFRLVDLQLDANGVWSSCSTVPDCCPGSSEVQQLSTEFRELQQAYHSLIQFIEREIAATAAYEKAQESAEDALKKCIKANGASSSRCGRAKESLAKAVGKVQVAKVVKELKDDWEKLWQTVTAHDEEAMRKLTLYTNNIIRDHYLLSSTTIYPTGDRLNVKVEITPSEHSLAKDWNSYPLKNIELSYNLPVIHKFYVSFSSGTFVGIGEDFYQRTYAYNRVPSGTNAVSDTNAYKLVQTGYSAMPIGLTALFNIAYKWAPSFATGLSFGVGATAEEKPRLAYMAGLSLFFGDKRQFVVSSGVCGMQTKVLKGSLYQEDTRYSFSSDVPQVEYDKQWGLGGFVSLSYTLFSTQTRKQSKSTSKNSEKKNDDDKK